MSEHSKCPKCGYVNIMPKPFCASCGADIPEWDAPQRQREQTYRQYKRTAVAEMADWHEGFDMAGVSISEADTKAGSPKPGDKIARNPANHDDRWLVAADYFAANFESRTPTQEEGPEDDWENEDYVRGWQGAKADSVDPRSQGVCPGCLMGDAPKMIDEDGTLCSVSGRPGRMGHGLDDAWWFCGDYAGTPASAPTQPSADVEALMEVREEDGTFFIYEDGCALNDFETLDELTEYVRVERRRALQQYRAVQAYYFAHGGFLP